MNDKELIGPVFRQSKMDSTIYQELYALRTRINEQNSRDSNDFHRLSLQCEHYLNPNSMCGKRPSEYKQCVKSNCPVLNC